MLKKTFRRKIRKQMGVLTDAIETPLRVVGLDAGRRNRPDMLFIWIPKTAGSSVFALLESTLGMRKLKTFQDAARFRNRGPVTFGHMQYLSLLQAGMVKPEFHSRAFKFAFARNPYARIASLYNYLTPRGLVDEPCFDRFLDSVRLRPPIGLYSKSGLSQANPQVDWLLDLTGNLLVDRVFKVEEIDEFPRFLNETYDLKTRPLEQLNTSSAHVTTEDIIGNAERREKINDLYAVDFDLLGYKKIDTGLS